eukprot:g19496.t1
MLVLCLDCLRNVFKPGVTGGTDVQTAQMFESYAAKEGALVLAVNLASMAAIQALHVMIGRCAKLEVDRDTMKRQAQAAGEFSKQLMAESKEGKAPETKMPEETKEKEDELRKRN